MIPLLATAICAIIAALVIWILRLQGELAEMRRTWRPRHDGDALPPMPWPAAGEQATANVVVGEVVIEDQDWQPQQPQRQYRVAWEVEP